MFSIENILRKNDFFENIFRRKPFYVEVNEQLILTYDPHIKYSVVELRLRILPLNSLPLYHWVTDLRYSHACENTCIFFGMSSKMFQPKTSRIIFIKSILRRNFLSLHSSTNYLNSLLKKAFLQCYMWMFVPWGLNICSPLLGTKNHNIQS